MRRLSGRSHEPSADRMTDRSCSNAGQNDLHSHQPREKKPAEEIIWPTNGADREVVQETRSWNDQHPKSAEVAHGVKPQRGPAHHLLDKHRCAAFSRTSWSVVDWYGIKSEGLLHSDRITTDAEQARFRRNSSQEKQHRLERTVVSEIANAERTEQTDELPFGSIICPFERRWRGRPVSSVILRATTSP